MHCPVCGAENEADAALCVECGASLENQVEPIPAGDDDRTIISPVPETIIDAEKVEVLRREDDEATVVISQEEMAKPQDEVIAGEPESGVPVPASGPLPGHQEDSAVKGSGLTSQRNLIIIAVVVVVLLFLCCCFFAILGGAAASLLEQAGLSYLPDLLPKAL